mmetsp:Transcript_146846/g.273467  ORF Transcript_146846/g.273467 Transcript_146846/m.273467 type:complete len:210 (+) Transcript_146846:5260-5889(+)
MRLSKAFACLGVNLLGSVDSPSKSSSSSSSACRIPPGRSAPIMKTWRMSFNFSESFIVTSVAAPTRFTSRIWLIKLDCPSNSTTASFTSRTLAVLGTCTSTSPPSAACETLTVISVPAGCWAASSSSFSSASQVLSAASLACFSPPNVPRMVNLRLRPKSSSSSILMKPSPPIRLTKEPLRTSCGFSRYSPTAIFTSRNVALLSTETLT